MIATWPAQYVGTRFDDHDENGAHCWGLVRRVYASERGVQLPAYGELSANDMVAMANTVNGETVPGGPWIAVDKGSEVEFDVAVMVGWVIIDGKKRRHPNHVGIITPNRHVLHVEKATAAVCVSLNHDSVKFRYRGAFRYIGNH